MKTFAYKSPASIESSPPRLKGHWSDDGSMWTSEPFITGLRLDKAYARVVVKRESGKRRTVFFSNPLDAQAFKE